jgi:DNA-binding NarL/FixJ family response regulator
MANPVITYIFCLDDHKGFSEDVKKRFSDTERYTVDISHNRDEILRHIGNSSGFNSCKVAILGLHDSKENFEQAEKIISEIKKSDLRTGIILLIPPDKVDEVKKTVRSNVDAYIPRNANSILRIHNMVKRFISEYNLDIYRRRKKISVYVLLGFVVLSAILALLAYFRLPEYF